MPALARKTAPDHYDQRTATASRVSSSRGVQTAPRRKMASPAPARRSTPAAPEADEVRELLSHFGHGSAEQESKTRAQLDAKREAKRRARRRHRPFRLTLTAGVLAAAPLCLLA